MEKEPGMLEQMKTPEQESEDIRKSLEDALGNYFIEKHNIALFGKDIPGMLEQMGIDEEKIRVAIKELDERMKNSGQKGFLK